MNCEELLRQLTAWEDGVLPDGVCDELQKHIAGCGTCQELRHDLEVLARICRGCKPPRLPDDLRRRLAAQLDTRSR